MVKSAWYDVSMRGRRLERIVREMNTKMWKAFKENNYDMAFSFLDRITILEKVIKPYADQMNGLDKTLEKHEKVFATA